MTVSPRSKVFGAALCAAAWLGAGCRVDRGLALSQMVEARTLVGDIRADFLMAVDRSSQAVMAETDESSTSAKHEAEDARASIEKKVDRLEAILKSLDFEDGRRAVEGFKAQYDEYKTLDDTILSLAV